VRSCVHAETNADMGLEGKVWSGPVTVQRWDICIIE